MADVSGVVGNSCYAEQLRKVGEGDGIKKGFAEALKEFPLEEIKSVRLHHTPGDEKGNPSRASVEVLFVTLSYDQLQKADSDVRALDYYGDGVLDAVHYNQLHRDRPAWQQYLVSSSEGRKTMVEDNLALDEKDRLVFPENFRSAELPVGLRLDETNPEGRTYKARALSPAAQRVVAWGKGVFASAMEKCKK